MTSRICLSFVSRGSGGKTLFWGFENEFNLKSSYFGKLEKNKSAGHITIPVFAHARDTRVWRATFIKQF